MRVVVHTLNGKAHTYDDPNLDVAVHDGILTIIRSRYQGPEILRIEYPLTSVEHWEYIR